MRRDEDFFSFVGHFDWYTFEKGIGYVPTENAPDYAAEAMKRHNKKMIERRKQGYYD